MIEAVMLWNEPNDLSHWDFQLDPNWGTYAQMVVAAGQAVRAERSDLVRVLGGISTIEEPFIRKMREQRALEHVDVVAVHGFPLDWSHWQIDEWPARIDQMRAVAERPIWVTEVGASTFGAEEVQEFGLTRSAKLLMGRVPRIHWYSLYDQPRTGPAPPRHQEAVGSSYHRHLHMGLVREDGTPKRAVRRFAALTPDLGICQWFHFDDHRLDAAVRWLKDLGVRHLRTGLSWADSFRPAAEAWFDRQMRALEDFEVTLTYCFTPVQRGVVPHPTSPPQRIEEFAEFCARMTRRYA
jgi:beta-xylosidase